MGVLNQKQRKASATVTVGGKAKFPIPDKGHAKSALGRLNQAKPPLTAAQKQKVKARAYRILGDSSSKKAGAGKAAKGKSSGKAAKK